VTSRPELTAALAEASRDSFRPPPPMWTRSSFTVPVGTVPFDSLHNSNGTYTAVQTPAAAMPEASTPVSAEIVSGPPRTAPVAVAEPVVAVVEGEPDLVVRIDLRAWRTRWFWRLVATIAVKRLRR
jgi:hypothetical protein